MKSRQVHIYLLWLKGSERLAYDDDDKANGHERRLTLLRQNKKEESQLQRRSRPSRVS